MDLLMTLTLTSGATIDLTVGDVAADATPQDFIKALGADGWVIDRFGTAVRVAAIAAAATRTQEAETLELHCGHACEEGRNCAGGPTVRARVVSQG